MKNWKIENTALLRACSPTNARRNRLPAVWVNNRCPGNVPTLLGQERGPDVDVERWKWSLNCCIKQKVWVSFDSFYDHNALLRSLTQGTWGVRQSYSRFPSGLSFAWEVAFYLSPYTRHRQSRNDHTLLWFFLMILNTRKSCTCYLERL